MEEKKVEQQEISEENSNEQHSPDELTESEMEAPVSSKTDLPYNQVPVDSGVTPQQEANDDAADAGLPENFTKEPQDIEHIDFTNVKDYKNWILPYQRVSDDDGHLLGDIQLEQEVKKLCKELDSVNLYLEENPTLWVDKIKDVATRYTEKLNISENTSFGIHTKHHIRQGYMFSHLRFLVKERLGKSWMQWVDDNFGKSLLRSIEDYMRIADVSNSIRYAVFGKERLLEIIRQLDKKNLKKTDPIGDFLRNHEIEFDPRSELDVKELKVKADIAISLRKLANEGLEQVSAEKVEAFFRGGHEIEPKHIRELKIVQKTRGDLNAYMDELIATGGKIKPTQTAEMKSNGFKKTLDRFLSQAADALKDQEYLGQVDLDLCKRLKDKLLELESKIASITN